LYILATLGLPRLIRSILRGPIRDLLRSLLGDAHSSGLGALLRVARLLLLGLGVDRGRRLAQTRFAARLRIHAVGGRPAAP
jgi:hypothetical protein